MSIRKRLLSLNELMLQKKARCGNTGTNNETTGVHESEESVLKNINDAVTIIPSGIIGISLGDSVMKSNKEDVISIQSGSSSNASAQHTLKNINDAVNTIPSCIIGIPSGDSGMQINKEDVIYIQSGNSSTASDHYGMKINKENVINIQSGSSCNASGIKGILKKPSTLRGKLKTSSTGTAEPLYTPEQFKRTHPDNIVGTQRRTRSETKKVSFRSADPVYSTDQFERTHSNDIVGTQRRTRSFHKKVMFRNSNSLLDEDVIHITAQDGDFEVERLIMEEEERRDAVRRKQRVRDCVGKNKTKGNLQKTTTKKIKTRKVDGIRTRTSPMAL